MSDGTNEEAKTAPVEASSAQASAPAVGGSDAAAAKPADDVVKTQEAPKTEVTKTEADPFPAKYKNADGTPNYEKLTKAYTNLEKKLGSKPTLPPVAADEYQFDFGERDIDPEASKQFKEAAFAAGLSQSQYEFALKTHMGIVDSLVWSADKTATALKTEWGQAYDTNIEAARTGFEAFAPSSANPEDPVWNHPEVMKLLARMGSEVGEDSMAGKNNGASKSAGKTQSEIAEIMKSDKYRNGDRELHAMVTDWYQRNTR
jgi:hypothetical protein